MARKAASETQATGKTRKRTARKASAPAAGRSSRSQATAAFAESFPRGAMSPSREQMAEMARMANMLTPAQAIELYKANAKMALDVINAALDSTAKMRRLQYAGEESAREFGKRTFEWRAPAAGWQWARVAVWDVAGNGAFVNPVWR